MDGLPLSYFKAIHGSIGMQSERDVRAAEYRRMFADEFDSSINVEHNVLRNGARQSFIIVPTDEGCSLWARPGETFNIGDIIYFNTLHWLVTDINFGDSLNRSGTMVRCNRQIQWQNPHTGAIVSRWCLATKPYTSNIEDGEVVANSNREYKIQIGMDEETILVGLNRRFLLEKIDNEPKAYEVVSVDTITNRYEDAGGGFLVWNLSQHEYNPATDNADLMIADYVIAGTAANSEPLGSLSAEAWKIDGASQIRQGTYRRYKLVRNGECVSAATVSWSVESADGVAVYQVDKGVLRLDVLEGAPIGHIVTLRAYADAHGTPVATLAVEVTPLL